MVAAVASVGEIAAGHRRLGEEHGANLVASRPLVVEASHRVAHHLEDLREDRGREELAVAVVERWVFEQRAGDELGPGAGEIRRDGTSERVPGERDRLNRSTR